MVLEEETVFQDVEQARMFASLLKKLGVSAHVRTKKVLNSEVVLTGESAALISLCRDICSLLTADNMTDQKELLALEEAIEKLNLQQQILVDTFREYDIGDPVGSSVLDLITGTESLIEGADDESAKELLDDIYRVRLLHLNDLVQYEEDAIILTGKIDPEKALLTIHAGEIPLIPDEMLTSYKIRTSLSASDWESATVSIGPEIVLLEDLTPITAFFTEYPQEEDVDLLSRIQVKQVIVSEILRLIEEEDHITTEKISIHFGECEIPPPDNTGDLFVVTHLSPAFIRDTIDDLRRSGLLRGKDNRLRLAA